MVDNYSVIPVFEKYPISTGISIISGTPFLYLQNHSALVLGDLHVGQETSLFNHDSGSVSNSCKQLTRLILKCQEYCEFSKVIFNGDIKHHTNSIKIQELEELRYLTSELQQQNIELVFIKGNHDKLLEFILPHIDLDLIEIFDFIDLGGILLTHGHLDEIDYSKSHTLILSHEHPAFTFRGPNRARIKVPAHVQLRAKSKDIIILPAANSISLGTNYPPKSKEQFISPFLQKYADLETLEIFPFDHKFGLFELPPIRSRFTD